MENKRKLASVRVVSEILPIPEADAIELAVVDGWKVVIKKNEFKVGDLCVYCEIDSWVPNELAPYLSKGKEPRTFMDIKGERLKTVRLRGQISQGLLLPISVLLNKDVSDILNVVKWEEETSPQLKALAKGNFPSFIKKTDEERIQNLFNKYKNLYKDVEFQATLKLDGTSCTYFVCNPNKYICKNDEPMDVYFGHCSRNLETKEGDSTPWELVKKLNIKDKMVSWFKNTGRSIALQGELMGPGIQKNREKFLEHKFFLFKIWDIDNQCYVSPNERKQIVKELGIDILEVPILNDSIKVFEKFNTVDDILKYAEIKSINNDIGEGIVFQSLNEINGEIISFKAISNLFLLKE